MSAVLDKRPISVLLARRGLPFVSLAVIGLVAWRAALSVPPAGLDMAAWHALVVFALCLVLWVSRLLPLAVTAILGLALLPMLSVLPASQTFAMFGSPAIFFILGAFMLAAGVMESGLSEHLALSLMERVGASPSRLLLVMLLLPAMLAAVMPEHAVAAVLLPLAWEVVRTLDLRPGDRFAQALFLALAWGAIIGGVATLLGGARGPLAMALMQELTGRAFSFAQWSLAALPMVLTLLSVGALVLLRAAPTGGLDMQAVVDRMERRRLELGRLGWRGRVMAVLLVGTVAAWMSAGHAVGLASIALISVSLMFALRLVDWRAIQSQVNWDVILLYGGAIAVGKAVAVTGAGAWLARVLLPDGTNGLGLVLLLALVTLLLTEGVSNAAAVAIMMPVAIPAAQAAGVDAMAASLTVGIVAGFAFMLPMGTPPNAMIFGTGYVRAGAMLRFGALMSLAALGCFAIAARFWWPMLDLGVK